MSDPATASPAQARPDVAAQLIMHFIRSVQEVLQTMSGLAVTVDPPVRNKARCVRDVSAVIGFCGQFVGSLVLSFPLQTAKAIVAGFAGSSPDPDSADFSDAIGELANMIAGGTKVSFGEAAQMSVPNMIFGPGHSIRGLQDVSCLVIPCHSAAGDFSVAINIKPAAAGGAFARSAAAPQPAPGNG